MRGHRLRRTPATLWKTLRPRSPHAPLIPRLLTWWRAVWPLVTFLVTVPILWPVARVFRRADAPWIIGGHRGRLRDDNAGALHRFLQEPVQSGAEKPRAIWIAQEPALLDALRFEGHPVLRMHSLAARWAIVRAPVLVYSHGESDLDLGLVLLRRGLGLRVYLNHCMNHIKAGERYSPVYDALTGWRKRVYEWVQTDFDWLVCSSDTEAANFARSYPHKVDRIATGGGAHLDDWIRGREVAPKPQLIWFPTFREDAAGFDAMLQQVRAVTANDHLRDWLLRTGRTFRIGAHINTATVHGEGIALHAPFSWLPPAAIKEAMCESELFISDYSGLLGDWLALDRPTIFFPFDLDAYLAHRRLYVHYPDLAWGPLVFDADALVAAILDASWQRDPMLAAKQRSWQARMIPVLAPIYAHATWQTIEHLRRAPHQRPPPPSRLAASPGNP